MLVVPASGVLVVFCVVAGGVVVEPPLALPPPAGCCGVISALRCWPAYLERNAATSSASCPTTMFSGMIAPEKPPLRIA